MLFVKNGGGYADEWQLLSDGGIGATDIKSVGMVENVGENCYFCSRLSLKKKMLCH